MPYELKTPTPTKVLTAAQALTKLRDYCAAAERPTKKVRDKAKRFGLEEEDIEAVLKQLREENFLSDERYAGSLARSRQAYRSWGPRKIEQKLRMDALPQPLVQQVIEDIPVEAFDEALMKVLQKKASQLDPTKEPDLYKRKQKLFRHAASKGYSPDKIFKAMNQFFSGELNGLDESEAE